MLATALRDVEGVSHLILNRVGQGAQILPARSDPHHRLERRLIHHSDRNIVILPYPVKCFHSKNGFLQARGIAAASPCLSIVALTKAEEGTTETKL